MTTSILDEVSTRRLTASKLLRFAKWAVIGAAVIAGINLALKPPMLAAYPGTSGDPLMKTLGYTLVFAIMLTTFKVVELKVFGGWIERKVNRGRSVRLSHVFNREIRATAIIGGVLQAIYGVLFISLVTVLPPTALAAAKSGAIVIMVFVEIVAGVLRGSLVFYLRLGLSIFVTLLGAAAVIFAGGFRLFPPGGSGYVWAFVALLIVGNLALALAELAELRGVNKTNVSAPSYTLARFVYYTITCAVAVLAWGLVNGGWSVLKGSVLMCIDRWYFFLPLALFLGLTDMVRICVKTVVSATYMYVVGSLSLTIDAVVQTIAKEIAPKTYATVHGGWLFPLICIGGGLVVSAGTLLFPQEPDERKFVEFKLVKQIASAWRWSRSRRNSETAGRIRQ